MATDRTRRSVLLKSGDHEYLAYEITDHAERPPTSIVVRLARHGHSKYAVFCTGSFSRGMLTKVYTVNPDNAESKEEREVIRLFKPRPTFAPS